MKIITGKPLKFFERQEIEIVKKTKTIKGISNYCCKEMKKACEDYNTGEKEYYNKKKPRIAHSRIYNKKTNEIGIRTHSSYNDASMSFSYDYYNYIKFKYCPFCGTKINGYIDEDEN